MCPTYGVPSRLTDDWARYMNSVADFLTENFKQRSMGLVCGFAEEISKVYTAVFPSNKVMQEILDKGAENAMLFVHHPSIWDIRTAPEIFHQMNRELLEKFRERKISIYNLHVPLDNFSEYSTGTSLAKVLEIKIEKPFAHYYGGLAGIIGNTECSIVNELELKLSKALGHHAKLYAYGDNTIKNHRIASVTGGGLLVEALREAKEEKINTYITGITAKNEYSAKAHQFAEENKINILGGTHYSTEKFACMAMCEYFKKLGLPSEFLKDKPILEDL